jgi:hypothetical protein
MLSTHLRIHMSVTANSKFLAPCGLACMRASEQATVLLQLLGSSHYEGVGNTDYPSTQGDFTTDVGSLLT